MNKIRKSKLRKDVINHFKMIARLYSAGVSLVESFGVFCDENNFDWKSDVMDNLKSGKTFGQSIEDSNLPMKDYELTIIKKSENSGNLSEGLMRVHEISKNIDKTRSKFILALLYPALISFVSLVLVLMILTIIVPKIKPLFNGGRISIPLTTKILFFLSSYLLQIIIIFFLIISVAFLMIFLFIKKRGKDSFRNLIFNISTKIPVVGQLVNHYSASISFRIAGEVFASSGLLVESLRDSAGGSIIPREKTKLLNAARGVENGLPLSKSISLNISKENRMWVPLIICGEQTGSISETFNSIAEIHQELFDDGISLINKLIEPISMIMVGLAVGFIAVSIITPMYSLISYTGY